MRAAVAAVVGAVGAGGAAAAPEVPDAQAPMTEPTEERPRIQLVLDLSGSMRENDAGGQTRLAAAKQSVGSIVDAAPPGVDIGIRVYGATYGGQDKRAGCQDTQLAVPIEPMDTPAAKTAAKQAVAGLDAQGFTPARRAQLQCIADAGGGSYVEARDAASLGSGLSALFRRQWKGYEATGTPVTGSPNGCADAPLIGPGQYLDRFVSDNSLYYRIRTRSKQILQVSATVVLTHSVSRISVVQVGAGPPKDFEAWINKTELLSGWNNVISVGDRTDADEVTTGEACIYVENGVNAKDDDPLPVELLIGLAGEGEGNGGPTARAAESADAASVSPAASAAASTPPTPSGPTSPSAQPGAGNAGRPATKAATRSTGPHRPARGRSTRCLWWASTSSGASTSGWGRR